MMHRVRYEIDGVEVSRERYIQVAEARQHNLDLLLSRWKNMAAKADVAWVFGDGSDAPGRLARFLGVDFQNLDAREAKEAVEDAFQLLIDRGAASNAAPALGEGETIEDAVLRALADANSKGYGPKSPAIREAIGKPTADIKSAVRRLREAGHNIEYDGGYWLK